MVSVFHMTVNPFVEHNASIRSCATDINKKRTHFHEKLFKNSPFKPYRSQNWSSNVRTAVTLGLNTPLEVKLAQYRAVSLFKSVLFSWFKHRHQSTDCLFQALITSVEHLWGWSRKANCIDVHCSGLFGFSLIKYHFFFFWSNCRENLLCIC